MPVQSTSTWCVHSTHGVHYSYQRCQTDCLAEGYTTISSYLSGPTLTSQHGEIRAGPQTSFQLQRLPVRPERGQSQTHPRLVVDPYNKGLRSTGRTDLSGPAADVPHRTFNSHRNTGPSGLIPYEAHTVVSEKQLEGHRATIKGDTSSTPPSSKMVARGKAMCVKVNH